jgi:Zn-finger protein
MPEYHCENHRDRQEWVVAERDGRELHLCQECYLDLIRRDNDRNKSTRQPASPEAAQNV